MNLLYLNEIKKLKRKYLTKCMRRDLPTINLCCLSCSAWLRTPYKCNLIEASFRTLCVPYFADIVRLLAFTHH